MKFPLKFRAKNGTEVILIGIDKATGNLIGFYETLRFNPVTLNCTEDSEMDLIEQIRPDPYGGET